MQMYFDLKLTEGFYYIFSPQMLLDINCQWVILGHSERRNVFNETDQVLTQTHTHTHTHTRSVPTALTQTV